MLDGALEDLRPRHRRVTGGLGSWRAAFLPRKGLRRFQNENLPDPRETINSVQGMHSYREDRTGEWRGTPWAVSESRLAAVGGFCDAGRPDAENRPAAPYPRNRVSGPYSRSRGRKMQQ